MKRTSLSSLKADLKQFVKGFGAYTMRVADPKEGFENAIPGCRPRDVWENCNSLIVFGIYVGLDYYRSLKLERKIAGEDRVMHIFRDWVQYKTVEHIREKGYNAVVSTGYFDRDRLIPRLSLKLAAHEAGLGVYGRCGIIITPEYGPRVNIGVVLTDAKLESDGKLANFDPCEKCRICVELCPPKAIQEGALSPTCHDRDRCVNFVLRLREKVGDNQFYCGYCYNFCPVGETDKAGFELSKHKTLLDLTAREREHLINEASLDCH